MKRIGNMMLSGLIKIGSAMPFPVLYALSDFVYFVIYYLVRYRRKLVSKNLRNSFPQLTEGERRKIEREFYRNFADYIFETVKYYRASYKTLSKRMEFENMELIERHFAEGRSIVTYFSHCGNWEWVTIMGERFRGRPDVQLAEVYRPLRNKWMDALMLRIRTRFNTACFPKATVFRELVRLKRDGILSCTGFMSDQKPSHGDRLHVVEFLNQPTAVITGTETVARKMKAAVVYFDMTKTRRGHYRLKVVPMADDASSTPEYQLTDRYFGLLQENILRQPAIWLWSHNRWKHKVELKDVSKESLSNNP